MSESDFYPNGIADENIVVFAVSLGGSTCFMTIDEAKDCLETIAETEDNSEYTIKAIVMTLGEFRSLPDFEGF